MTPLIPLTDTLKIFSPLDPAPDNKLFEFNYLNIKNKDSTVTNAYNNWAADILDENGDPQYPDFPYNVWISVID